MATSAPHPMPSLRNMRDTYVNLLLSNGPQPAESAPPQTPRPSWTPGQSLGTSYKEHAVHWASPVTPGLTENEMRVAEVAANLVAAGDAEKRNKDAIRALADQLEQTERRNRELEAAVRTEEKKRKEKRRVSYGDARRNIHFTPRTPCRSGGVELGSERRRSRKLERDWVRESPFHLELESLRMEQTQWHQEREKFRSMMSDIKRNTSRLLEERDKLRRHRDNSSQEREAHLQVIARLQSQLLEKKQREEEFKEKQTSSPAHRRSDGEIHFPSPPTMYHQGLSNVAIFRHPEALNQANNERPNEVHNLSANSSGELTAASLDEMSGAQDEFGREEELQTELHLVNRENIRVSERNEALEAENAQLQERIRQLETEHETLRGRLRYQQQNARTDSVAGNLSAAVNNTQLANLLEEINILESVSDAIHFEISPSEADRAQETLEHDFSNNFSTFNSAMKDPVFVRDSNQGSRMTTPGSEDPKQQGLSNRECQNSKDVIIESPANTMRYAIERLAVIRTDLCSKYGKWLEAVANDVSSAGGETELESMDKENMLFLDVASECMNTKVINELVES